MEINRPLRQFIDLVGRDYVASEMGVHKQTIYFWLCREDGDKNHDRGVGKNNAIKLLTLAKKHNFKKLNLDYLVKL